MATTKDDDKEARKKKANVEGGSSGSVFDDQPKKNVFDNPPAGGLFDSAESSGSVSPFEIDIEVFQPDENDIDQAVDGVFTSAKPDVLSSDDASKKGSAGGSAIGRRKETSILFSLGNLHSLANDPDSAENAAIDANAPSQAGNMEMSGLIDIRALKDSFVTEKEDHMDDLLSLGGEAFSPVLTFQARGLSQRTKLTIIGVSAALVVALVIVFVFALSGGEDETAVDDKITALQAQIEELRASGGGDTAQVAALEAKLAEVKEQETTASDSEKEMEGEKDDSDSKSFDRKKDGSSKNYKLKSKDAPANTSPEPEQSPEPTPKKISGELDDLLGGSSSGSKKIKSNSSSSSSGGAKKSLDRSDVQKGLGAVAGKVKACGNGTGGFVTLKIVIGANGSVLTAQPTGEHSGTSVGTCAAKAVKSAKFPKTQSSTTVSYPFKL